MGQTVHRGAFMRLTFLSLLPPFPRSLSRELKVCFCVQRGFLSFAETFFGGGGGGELGSDLY